MTSTPESHARPQEGSPRDPDGSKALPSGLGVADAMEGTLEHEDDIDDFLTIARKLANREQAHQRDDAFGVASLAVVEAIDRYQPDLGVPLRAWVCRQTQLRLIDAFRFSQWQKRDRLRQTSCDVRYLASDDPTPEQEVEWREAVTLVRRAVESLADPERSVLTLAFGLGDSPVEIGDQIGARLGVTRRTVERIRAHAFSQLRRVLPRSLLSA